MEKRIARLDQALHVWEDLCLLKNKQLNMIAARYNDVPPADLFCGPIVHAPDFRNYLIRSGVQGYLNCDLFADWGEMMLLGLKDIGSLPVHLFAWSKSSRRVFHLSRDFQTLLSATSLDDVCWGEVRLPFQSFVLTLDENIVDVNGNNFDTILVTNLSSVTKKWEGSAFLEIAILSTKLEAYHPVDKEKIAKITKPKKWDDEKMQQKMLHMSDDYFKALMFATEALRDTPISKSSEEVIKEGKMRLLTEGKIELTDDPDQYSSCSALDKAKHLVLSVCLYLATLPPKKFPDDWQPTEKDKEPVGVYNPAAITTPNGIFTIACESTLSQESQETIAEIKQSRISREKRPHWRRGHWRRERGGRNNPEASRIWIRPCLINKHRLPPKSLPIGSTTILDG